MFILLFLYLTKQELIASAGDADIFIFIIMFLLDCVVIDAICDRIRGDNE